MVHAKMTTVDCTSFNNTHVFEKAKQKCMDHYVNECSAKLLFVKEFATVITALNT